MSWKVTKIIKQKGDGLLNHPEALEAELRSAGCSETDLHTTMLVLYGCPAVAATLTAGTPTKTEIHNLIRSITRETGLSVRASRRVLGQLMFLCGMLTPEALAHSAWPARLFSGVQLSGTQMLSPEIIWEDAQVQKLAAVLDSGTTDAAVLSKLDLLASQGHPEAAYYLGLHFRDQGDPAEQKKAQAYFTQAAQLGYGPAHGALADCLSQDVRQLGSALRHIRHPIALCGTEGRKWRGVMDKLLQYQRSNLSRLRGMLRVQLLSLLAMALLLYLCGTGVCMVLAAGLQTAALAWTLWARYRQHHLSCAVPGYLLVASWSMIPLGILSGGGGA